MKLTFFAIAVLAGLLACTEASSEPHDYGIVELPGGAAEIDNPGAQYDALRDLAFERAAEEAGDRANAYRNGTYFGADSDSLLVYAITPVKGVFYHLPVGPYPKNGNTIITLPDVMPVCRFEVRWAEVTTGPFIADMEEIDLVSKDCVPLNAQDYPMDPIDKDSALTLIEAAPVNGNPVNAVISADKFARFDHVRALATVLEADGARLVRTVPLKWGHLAGISDHGDVSVLIQSAFLERGQRCVVSGLDWSDLNDGRMRIAAERSCETAARTRK